MATITNIAHKVYNSFLYDLLTTVTICTLVTSCFFTEKIFALFNIALVAGLLLALVHIILYPKKIVYGHLPLILLLAVPFVFLCSILIHGDYTPDAWGVFFKKARWAYLGIIFGYLKIISFKWERVYVFTFLGAILLLFFMQMGPYVVALLWHNQTIAFHHFQPGNHPYLGLLHHVLSVFFVIGIACCIFLVLKYNSQASGVQLGLIWSVVAILTLGVFLTGARIGWLALLVCIVIFLVYTIQYWSKIHFLFAMGVVLAVVSLYFYLNSQSEVLAYRFNATWNEIHYLWNADFSEKIRYEGNMSVRLLGYIHYADLLFQNPWIGVCGPSEQKYAEALHQLFLQKNIIEYAYSLQPASQWFKYIAQMGFPLGCLFFILLFLSPLVSTAKQKWLPVTLVCIYFLFSLSEASFDARAPFHALAVSYVFLIRATCTYQ